MNNKDCISSNKTAESYNKRRNSTLKDFRKKDCWVIDPNPFRQTRLKGRRRAKATEERLTEGEKSRANL